jgi:hypothetical protein
MRPLKVAEEDSVFGPSTPVKTVTFSVLLFRLMGVVSVVLPLAVPNAVPKYISPVEGHWVVKDVPRVSVVVPLTVNPPLEYADHPPPPVPER